ncbi:hypothetical protein RHSIM_Rhsim12G0188900 [Rhododendron simsii]|uniref:Uncharacterized protein n=1 Tax=Rhododendron simsii TaxID=118357 RepID=A0A834G702_RHOSS|nr:hypothetical protein RHSIM_Rhsim12G0188900 [Rhododendron simsii]
MSQATSTSTSASTGASPEDIFRLPATMMIPGDSTSSSASTPTQAFHFSSGNPRIEETRGVMHLYRDDFAPSSPSQLPVISLSPSLLVSESLPISVLICVELKIRVRTSLIHPIELSFTLVLGL